MKRSLPPFGHEPARDHLLYVATKTLENVPTQQRQWIEAEVDAALERKDVASEYSTADDRIWAVLDRNAGKATAIAEVVAKHGLATVLALVATRDGSKARIDTLGLVNRILIDSLFFELHSAKHVFTLVAKWTDARARSRRALPDARKKSSVAKRETAEKRRNAIRQAGMDWFRTHPNHSDRDAATHLHQRHAEWPVSTIKRALSGVRQAVLIELGLLESKERRLSQKK